MYDIYIYTCIFALFKGERFQATWSFQAPSSRLWTAFWLTCQRSFFGRYVSFFAAHVMDWPLVILESQVIRQTHIYIQHVM